MSNRYERSAEDAYEAQNDPSPVSGTYRDNTYAHETQSSLRGQVSVAKDEDYYDDPMQPPYSNSDQQLGMILSPSLIPGHFWVYGVGNGLLTQECVARDEDEALDQSNVIQGRTRGAKPQTRNLYSEGPGEDDLPDEVLYGNSGGSSI